MGVRALIQRVRAFPVLRDVEPLVFLLRAHAQPHRRVQDFQQHIGDGDRIDSRRQRRDRLGTKRPDKPMAPGHVRS